MERKVCCPKDGAQDTVWKQSGILFYVHSCSKCAEVLFGTFISEVLSGSFRWQLPALLSNVLKLSVNPSCNLYIPNKTGAFL